MFGGAPFTAYSASSSTSTSSGGITTTTTTATTTVLGKSQEIYFLKDPSAIRQGLALSNATQYNVAWHLNSFYFGRWSDKFFPLLYCPEIIITFNT